jgi:glucose uptake protein GlcU
MGSDMLCVIEFGIVNSCSLSAMAIVVVVVGYAWFVNRRCEANAFFATRRGWVVVVVVVIVIGHTL